VWFITSTGWPALPGHLEILTAAWRAPAMSQPVTAPHRSSSGPAAVGHSGAQCSHRYGPWGQTRSTGPTSRARRRTDWPRGGRRRTGSYRRCQAPPLLLGPPLRPIGRRFRRSASLTSPSRSNNGPHNTAPSDPRHQIIALGGLHLRRLTDRTLDSPDRCLSLSDHSVLQHPNDPDSKASVARWSHSPTFADLTSTRITSTSPASNSQA
jgi:hypothetical protein